MGLVGGGFNVEGEVGGVQVAMVKASTSLRMKKRGKVPPRLETLFEKDGVRLSRVGLCGEDNKGVFGEKGKWGREGEGKERKGKERGGLRS